MKISNTVAIIAAVLILISGGWWFLSDNKVEEVDEPIAVACTEEAKICLDGSSVSRSGPNCDFTECPSITVSSPVIDEEPNTPEPVEWITYTDSEWKYSFDYPNNYTLTKDTTGYKVILSPPGDIEKKTDFFAVVVIQYPEVEERSEIPAFLFGRANYPDGKIAWLKDSKFYSHEDYVIDVKEILFGNDRFAFKSRENSIEKGLGEYRSIVYVLRDPVVYRVTHDLLSENVFGEVIKRIEDSFTVNE
ncbi:MAG: hypothetical protein ACI9GH_000394 [Candidatus Paceibacteria bacterium]|jgi:hypothetical protein